MTQKNGKNSKLNTDQKVDQILEVVQELSKKQDNFDQRLNSLEENQELMLVTMNDFSTRIESKMATKKDLQGMENRMVNKDYLDKKFASAGIKTSTIPV